MKELVLLIMAAMLTAPPASRASEVKFRPLMAPFFKVYKQDAPSRRLVAMKDLLAKHPALYGQIIPVPGDEQLAKYIADQEPKLHIQGLIADAIEAQFPKTLATFEKHVGPLKPTTVYVAPSLFTSNGQVRMVQDHPVVVFGPDVQAYVVENIAPQNSPYDVRALVAHEFFHAQHYAVNPEIASSANALFAQSGKPPLYLNLWIEGLATCVSMMFDGDGRVTDALMSEELSRDFPVRLPQVAQEFRAKLVSASDDDYRDFFWLSGQRTDLPKRSGYALGAVVADRIVHKIGVDGAMRLQGESLKVAISDALEGIATETGAMSWSTICQ